MLHELIARYGHHTNYAIDVSWAFDNHEWVKIFNKKWDNLARIETVDGEHDYMELSHVLADNRTRITMITFELLQGDPANFHRHIKGVFFEPGENEYGEIGVYRSSNYLNEKMRYIKTDVTTGHDKRFEILMPRNSTVRISFYEEPAVPQLALQERHEYFNHSCVGYPTGVPIPENIGIGSGPIRGFPATTVEPGKADVSNKKAYSEPSWLKDCK